MASTRRGFGSLGRHPLPWPTRVTTLMAEVAFAPKETLTIDLPNGPSLVLTFDEFFSGTFDEALAICHPTIDRAALLDQMREGGYR